MSSFIGHGLAALTVYALGPEARPARWGWLAWLGVLALAPDIDYVVAPLLMAGLALLSLGFMLWASRLPR